MNQFQKQFIQECYSSLLNILSNKQSLALAVEHFSKGNSDDPRYQIRNISDANDWDEQEKLQLSGAVSEAIFNVSSAHVENSQVLLMDIHNATEEFKKNIIPKITANTQKNNRLNSVIENIQQIQAENESIYASRFGFFAVAAAVVVAAGYTFTKK